MTNRFAAALLALVVIAATVLGLADTLDGDQVIAVLSGIGLLSVPSPVARKEAR